MAGHSKWANIKHRKGAMDKKRGKIFTKLIKEISVAAKTGGIDPDTNPRLRLAIQNAKGANMPKDNIERALKKASGNDATDYAEITYEGYVNGIAIYVECATDNLKRTVANVRSYFNKGGGALGTNGSLEFMFERKGFFTLSQEKLGEMDEELFILELADAGADDVDREEGLTIITCPMESFGSVQKKLDEMDIEADNAELQRIPTTTTVLDNDTFAKTMKIIEMLEDDDDVQKVYHNIDISDEQAAAF